MPPPTNTLSFFTLFPLLPPELREQIFIIALEDEIPPAFFYYKKGCWHSRLLPRLYKDDEGYDPTDLDPLHAELLHHHDLLDVVQVFVSLIFVNRAARDIAISWIRNSLYARGIEVREGILTTSFIPTRDVLYVGVDGWDDFTSEPNEFQKRSWEEEGLDPMVTWGAANVRRLAFPSKLLERQNILDYDLEDLISPQTGLYCLVRELLIVVDAPLLDLQSASKGPNQITRPRQRWEYISIDGGVFRWNKERSGWDFDDGDRVAGADNALFERLGAMHKNFGLEFSKSDIRDFTIRFVVAVRA